MKLLKLKFTSMTVQTRIHIRVKNLGVFNVKGITCINGELKAINSKTCMFSVRNMLSSLSNYIHTGVEKTYTLPSNGSTRECQ